MSMVTDLYPVQVRWLLNTCHELAMLKYTVGIRLVKIHADGTCDLIIGERTPGQRRWLKPVLPAFNILGPPYTGFVNFPDTSTSFTYITETWYAHTYLLPRLHERTVRNEKSACHLMEFLIQSWLPVGQQEIISDEQ